MQTKWLVGISCLVVACTLVVSVDAQTPDSVQRAKQFFQKNDANQDGRLSRNELRRKNFFDRLDTNKDGFLTLEETPAFQNARDQTQAGEQGRQIQRPAQVRVPDGIFVERDITHTIAGEGKQKLQYVYKTIGDRELKADILYPNDWKSTDRRPAIVFFSGGGWRAGNTRQFLRQAGYFAKRGLVTVRAEYRDSMIDKVKPDTCLQDAVSAMRWVRKNADRLGIDPERIASSGGSAGGYLAAAVATIDDYYSLNDDLSVSAKPNAMVLFNPVLDFMSLDMASRYGLELKLAARISPLRHVEKDLPPTLILIGSKDQFLDQNRDFMSRARELGVRVEIDLAEGQPHAYFNRSPWMEKTVSSADRFLVSLGYLTEEPRVELPSSEAQP